VTCFYVGEFVAARSLPEQCHRLGDPAHCAGAGIYRSLCDHARAPRLHLGELHEAMSDDHLAAGLFGAAPVPAMASVGAR
jgi:hypothetical protein